MRPDGTPFHLGDLAGHPVLVFFGYTHCPDVCPTTIGELMGVLAARPDVRAVFVSIDPERDTPASMATWTRYMPEAFVGLTGTPAAVRTVADRYGARYARLDTTSKAGYAMSHTADVYLIDPQGRLLATYPYGTKAAAMVADLERLGS